MTAELIPDESLIGVVLSPRVQEIIQHERAGDEHQYSAANLIFAELEDRGYGGQTSLAREIGKSPDHVRIMQKIGSLLKSEPGIRDTPFNDLYNSPQVRAAIGSGDRDRDELPPVTDDEWYTPQWLFDGLGLTFSIDVCSPADRKYVSVPAGEFYALGHHLEDHRDGLTAPWRGTVWCNPPYSSTDPWARRMIEHGDGLILCHIPMNAGWCADLWHACDGIRLFQAMEFVRPDGSLRRPAWWLQLAAFGPHATAALERLKPPLDVAENERRVPSPMWRRA